MSDQPKTQKLSDLLDALRENTDGDKVSLGDLLDAFSHRSFGPLLLVPAVIAVGPTGAIPGMSIVTGSIIFLIAVQMLFGLQHPWLPDRLLAFSFSRDRLKVAIDKAMPWAVWVEKAFRHRLDWVSRGPAIQLVALICIVLSLTMFPLALLPFAVAAPGGAIALLALGLSTRDGLLMILGYLIAAGTIWLCLYFWPF